MSNVPEIINLTLIDPAQSGPYPVRSLIFIPNVNPLALLNGYMTQVQRFDLSIFRTRFLRLRKCTHD